MTESDKVRFSAAMEAAGVVYGREVNTMAKRIYFDACREMTIDDFEEAVARHIRTSQFFPRPADLMRPENLDYLAIEAYRIADEAMAKHGSYRHVDFEDRAINAAIRSIGGWSVFGATTSDEEPFVRERFVKAYKAYRTTGASDDACRPLAGIADATSCKRDEQGRITETTVTPVVVRCSTTAKIEERKQARIG